MLSIARFAGIFVKSDTTSKDIKTFDASIVLPEIVLNNSKLLFTLLFAGRMLIDKISCIYVAMEYNAVLTEETMILKGPFSL